MNDDPLELVRREAREQAQITLFDREPDWRSHCGMPEFSNDDIRPESRLIVNFMTAEDRRAFTEKLNVRISPRADTLWYPHQQRLSGCEFYYDGEKVDSRYPVCIPSKGRWDVQTTGRVLDSMGVSYRFFVEETEGEKYIAALGSEKVVVMPFHDLGQGSIPARNFIWDWARDRGLRRHWTVDDNITEFRRTHVTRRLRVRGGSFFQAMEDFVDRYDNIAMAGPHHLGFVKVGWSEIPAFLLNTRVYSCILLDTALPHRWRGRYNEDTDLSLRLLKDGFCTCVFAALLMNKAATVGVRNAKPMNGGNTDHVYNTGDHRLAFAESLKEQHPDCVEVVWKFNRWHHQVDYSRFRKNRPRYRSGLVPSAAPNEYGMTLRRADREQEETFQASDVDEADSREPSAPSTGPMSPATTTSEPSQPSLFSGCEPKPLTGGNGPERPEQ